MVLNRRHKAILFLTLVSSGCALFLGADLKQMIGYLMLGTATAWAAGSDATSKTYCCLKGTSGAVYSWIRVPLGMALAGALLAIALLCSGANPVAAVVVTCAAGVFLALVAPFPTKNIYWNILLLLVGILSFVASTFGVLSIDAATLASSGDAYGQLSSTGLIIFITSYFWLYKGWELIQRGIAAPSIDTDKPAPPASKPPWSQYIVFCLGLTILMLWLSLLAWLTSSDWEYGPKTTTSGSNLLAQLILLSGLTAWPYYSWRSILWQESNSDPKHLRRHRVVSGLAGVIFVSVISLAVTFGIQNGEDRRLTTKVTEAVTELRDVAGRLGEIKRRDLETTDDYIKAYSEIDSLLPEFEVKLKQCELAFREAQRASYSRGLLNMQDFYKSHNRHTWPNLIALLNALWDIDSLTKHEVATVQRMATLQPANQVNFWREQFKPLLSQEDVLQRKLQIAATRVQSDEK